MMWVNDAVATLQGISGVSAFLFVLVFFVFGKPWSAFFNRGIFLLEMAILAIMVYALERHAVAPSAPIPDHQWIPALIAWGSLGVVQVLLSAGLYQVLVRRRGGIRAARATKRSRDLALATTTPEPVETLVAALDRLDDDEYAQVSALVRQR